MLEFVRNKRAITPVLSNVLMMLIAVAGMSIALAATYVITINLRDIMGERFIIEDVWFRSGEISIYLRNTGKVSIRLVAVYINYMAQSFTPLKLDVQSHGWLNITYSWAPNLVYHIKLVTNRGTQIADYYRSPTST
jgi:E3 ubiquitin-protein ligase DOA10